MSSGKQESKGLRIGEYELQQRIGKGTFAEVREGIHLVTGEKVAVKVIDKDSIEDTGDQQRVQREVEIMRRLRHPNIAYLYEVVETDRYVYLMLEHAEQGELFTLMNNEGRLKEHVAGQIFLQVLDAVQYLHRLGIAHRDLKPQNILLDFDYNVKLIDFGLSNYSPRGTMLHTACGSPCYAPPEMVAGKKYDGIVGDMWSLGIIFYAMLCAALPFEEQTPKELYARVVAGDYVLPSHLSMEAIEVIRSMLVTDPTKRILVSQLRKLKFFKGVRDTQPELVGLIVGFHAMPVDGEILAKMKAYQTIDQANVEEDLRQNQHNQLTALYYILQKKSLRQGNRTVVDLQAYLETSAKYANDYGKNTLKKYHHLSAPRKIKQKEFFSQDRVNNTRLMRRLKAVDHPPVEKSIEKTMALDEKKTHRRLKTQPYSRTQRLKTDRSTSRRHDRFLTSGHKITPEKTIAIKITPQKTNKIKITPQKAIKKASPFTKISPKKHTPLKSQKKPIQDAWDLYMKTSTQKLKKEEFASNIKRLRQMLPKIKKRL